MKWVETIKLRVSESDRKSVNQELSELILKLPLEGGLSEIKLYQHALLKNDFSINLYGQSERLMPQGSPTGLCLLHLVKPFGLITHSVWVEA